jgi:zinc transporter ZupT
MNKNRILMRILFFSVNDENTPLLGNGHSENGTESRLRYASNTESLTPLNSVENPILAENSDGQHDHTHMDGVFHHSTLRSLILLMALSFHSVFEGLAIGLQESLSQLISLFLAVIAHKGNFNT